MRDVLPYPGRTYKEFSGGPLIRSLHFHCHGLGLIPGQGSKIPQPKKKKKERKEFIKEVAPIYFFFNHGLALIQGYIREWKFGRENFFGKTIRSKATYSSSQGKKTVLPLLFKASKKGFQKATWTT